jgi:hypothetical protein
MEGGMSDIWTTDCRDCKGSGEITVSDYHPDFGPYEIDCPTCKGNKMALWVKCGCKSGRRGRDCHDYHIGKNRYRPLSSEEVDEVVLSFEIAEGHMAGITVKDKGINQVLEGYSIMSDNPLTTLTYKGQQVTLRPLEEE